MDVAVAAVVVTAGVVALKVSAVVPKAALTVVDPVEASVVESESPVVDSVPRGVEPGSEGDAPVESDASCVEEVSLGDVVRRSARDDGAIVVVEVSADDADEEPSAPSASGTAIATPVQMATRSASMNSTRLHNFHQECVQCNAAQSDRRREGARFGMLAWLDLCDDGMTADRFLP